MTVAPGTVPVGRSSYASGQCAPEGYPTLSNTAAAFLAGLLEHLPGKERMLWSGNAVMCALMSFEECSPLALQADTSF